jgi:hypothetical protein
MNDRKKSELQALYTTWDKDSLLSAIGPRRADYEPEALQRIVSELKTRGVSDNEISFIQAKPIEAKSVTAMSGWLKASVAYISLLSFASIWNSITYPTSDWALPINFVHGIYGFFTSYMFIRKRGSSVLHARIWIMLLIVIQTSLGFGATSNVWFFIRIPIWGLWLWYFWSPKTVNTLYRSIP